MTSHTGCVVDSQSCDVAHLHVLWIHDHVPAAILSSLVKGIQSVNVEESDAIDDDFIVVFGVDVRLTAAA